MKYVRWLFSWMFFLLGDLMSRLEWITKGHITAAMYQFFMTRSHEIQGSSNFGPWGGPIE